MVQGLKLACCCLAFSLSAHLPIAAADDGGRSLTVKEVSLDESVWKWRGDLKDGLALREGRLYRSEDAVRSVNILRATGFFTNVDLVTFFDPDGVRVRFDLAPVEMVSAIAIEGNFFLLQKEIRAVVRSSAEEAYDLGTVEKDRERIKELYARRGFFGTEVGLSVKPDPQGWGVAATFNILEGKPGVVQRVSFRGNRQMPAKELSAHHQIIGLSYYDPEKAEEAVDAILGFYRQEGFIAAKVSLETKRSSGTSLPSLSLVQPLKSITTLLPGQYLGVDLAFIIDEGEKYDIGISGNREVGDAEIRKLIAFYRSGFFDQYEADESGGEILAHYRNNGYYHAAVEVSLDREMRTAHFVISEGPKVKLESIAFEGAAFIAEEDLLRLMDSDPGLLGPRLYRADVLEKDLNKIKAYYVSKGFTRVALAVGRVAFNASRDLAALTITVSEGPRSKVQTVDFSGATLFGDDRLRRAVRLPDQSGYDPDWVEEAKKRLLDLYSREGYPDCLVNADLRFSPDGEWVEVRFFIREGKRKRLGRILVEGNRHTRAAVIIREFDMAEGDAYDPIKIYQGRRSLFETGNFSRVEIVNPEASTSDLTDLVIRVREKKRGRVSLGVGYDSEEQYRVFAELGETNLWGTGRAIRLKARLTGKGTRYDLIYKEPWFIGFHQDINVNLYNDDKEETGYDLRRLGLRLFSDRSLGRYTNLYTAYRYESVDYSHVRPSLLDEEDLPDEFRIGSLQVRLSHDRRDNAVNPHRGYTAGGSVEAALPFLGSETDYAKYELSAAYVQPTSSFSEAILSIRLGLADGIGRIEDLPLSERFFTGGANSVRGYEEKSLGPKDIDGNPLGGDVLVLGNIEWRFRFYRSFGGVIFLDAGNVWSKLDDFSPADIRQSVGGGLRYETPVGPVRLECGYRLDPEPGEDRYRIHFTLGHPF